MTQNFQNLPNKETSSFNLRGRFHANSCLPFNSMSSPKSTKKSSNSQFKDAILMTSKASIHAKTRHWIAHAHTCTEQSSLTAQSFLTCCLKTYPEFAHFIHTIQRWTRILSQVVRYLHCIVSAESKDTDESETNNWMDSSKVL